MEEDAKGFLYPHVDKQACINCGLCDRVCPLQLTNIHLNAPTTAFAAWNRCNEEHQRSSSGGVAYVFSAYILNKGGVVYGCVSTGLYVHHIRVDNLKDLALLQGSKYVQSDVRGIFNQIKADLKQQRSVLFIGTPCQVAGLKNYIRTVPPHLYLVDLICHGVPSQRMLSAHIAPISKGQEVTRLSFRRGSIYTMEVSGSNFSYERHYWRDAYMRMFINGFISSPSCYSCPYATSSRAGDVTIGDFWGLGVIEEHPTGTNEAISVLLPCTNKGCELVKAVADKLVLHERKVIEAVNGNPQLHHPVHRTCRNRIFNILWPLLPFDTAAWLCISDQLMAGLKRRISKMLF